MNTREAMQALLDGKKIRASNHKPGVYVTLDKDGQLRNQHGSEWNWESVAMVAPRWELYEEPNPHTKGTFAWAREEAKRGRQVRRASFMSSLRYNADQLTDGTFCLPLAHIDATDWEIVS